jgi:serine/threonine-protein kinase
MIGTVIKDQYRILELIGEGGMGSVYMALDIELDRHVALKFLKTELGDNSILIQRFRDELRTLAGFNHQNITTLFTSVNYEGQPVMVMELVEGETLQRMIDRRGPIPADVCVPLICQSLAGLGYAHRKKIIHRDLKPANLMLNSDGVVKVMDFGIAKIQNAPGLTRTNVAVGTSLYMAPEQIRGLTVDARSDIYAMGVTLYEMLAGRVPFLGDSQYEIEHAHIQQTPEPPTVHYPHIPSSVVDAVMQALAKDPALRFQTADEFNAALSGKSSTVIPGPPVVAPASVVSTATIKIEPPAQASAAQSAIPKQAFAAAWATTGEGRRGVLSAALVVVALLAVSAGAVWIRWPHQGNSTIDPPKVSGPGERTGSLSVQPADGGAGTGNDGINGTGRSREIPESPARPFERSPAVPLPVPEQPSGPIASRGDDAPVPRAVVEPEIGYGVAGQWAGTYDRCEDNRSTRVVMTLTEPSQGQINGSLSFATPDGANGRCSLNGVFVEKGKQLTIKAGSCSGSTPGYFTADHQSLLTFSGAQLIGNVEPQEPCMTVNLKRSGK